MNKINVAIVNYLNTKPFLYGLDHSDIKHQIELIECIPALCAEYFLDGTADISLVPVGALINEEYILVNNYGIGSKGKVSSVCLLSNVSLDKIDRIYLDYQSRTSVLLIQVLLKHYWKLEIEMIDALPGFETTGDDRVGMVIIGDRAMHAKASYTHCYDLGEVWEKYTGLPFVYAAWCTHKVLDPVFISDFNQALKNGMNSRQEVIKSLNGYSVDLQEYFYNNIQYEFDEKYYDGMNLFLQLAAEFNSVSQMKV